MSRSQNLSANAVETASTQLAEALIRHYRSTARDLPWRRTTDPYAIWLSETMLQQTQVKTVIPYFERWLAELPDIKSLCSAPQDQLLRLWSGLGYYSRATRLQLAARQIQERFPRGWPSNPQEWLELPGVGRYTAGAVCSIAFNQPTPIVDGNIDRVLSRLHGLSEPRESKEHQERLWLLANDLVLSSTSLHNLGGRRASDLNQSLMELGAVTCTPRNPECPKCPVHTFCRAFLAGDPTAYPAPKKRPTQLKKSLHVWILHSREKFFVQKQAAGAWNAGLWQFPATAPDPTCPPLHPALFRLTHSITRHNFRVEVFLLRGKTAADKAKVFSNGTWLNWTEMATLALSGLQRKILKKWSPAGPPKPLSTPD
jgi:A/G-specific adenine glycosylase